MKAGEPPTVLVPDIIITRDACAAANSSRLEAADVLVAIEIISPGTGTTDRVTKMYEYADAGILHYWLVDLDQPVTLTAYTLVDGNYEHVVGGTGTVTIPSPVGITLTLDALIIRCSCTTLAREIIDLQRLASVVTVVGPAVLSSRRCRGRGR